jgi:hypothetical protein
VASDSLREELMALPGIADAEVDAEDGSPSGVRVRLRPDADPQKIGAMVQRVLASHGMRSRVAGDHGDLAPVVSLPFAPIAIPPRPEAPPPTPEALAPARPDAEPPRAEEIRREPPTSVDRPTSDDPHPTTGQAGGRRTLAALAYEEAADGVTVTAVAEDGQRFSRRAAATTDDAVGAAIVAAVGALAEGKPQRMLWMSAATVEGSEVVTVVVEKTDGTRVAGAAIVRAAKAYAVARAAFVALRS